MTQRDANFRIEHENFAAALAAIKALATRTEKMGGGEWRDGKVQKTWFSWVTTEEFVEATTLQEAIKAWRWSVEVSEESGDIVDICFDGEKLGDDTILLEAIAPYVEAGSFIDMEGEDGSLWRWAFDGRGVVELAGTVSYEGRMRTTVADYTITFTVNFHVKASSSEVALAVARKTLPSAFDVIDEDIKLSSEQDNS